jgi:hypothetical protein
MNDTGVAPTMDASEKKALTIHLYRVEEVLACFRLAILTRNIRETLFWGLELFDSDYEMDLFEMLGLLWFNQIGLGSWGVFQATWAMLDSGELDRDELQKLLVAWCRVPKQDASVFLLLARGILTPADWKPAFPHTQSYSGPEDAILDCLRRGKILEAWLFARALEPEAQWCILEGIGAEQTEFELLKKLTLGTEIQRRAMAFLVVGVDKQLWSAAPIDLKNLPPEIASLVAEWDVEENLRKRRVYPVRMEALGWFTARGSLPTSASTEADLMGEFEETLWASPYWRKILETYHVVYYSGSLLWNDKCKEAFYDTYFPWTKSDIPDEWPAADRQKSHHRGLGKPPGLARTQMIQQLLRSSTAIVVWSGLQGLKADAIGDWNFEIEYKKLQGGCATRISWPLQPVKLQFEIPS